MNASFSSSMGGFGETGGSERNAAPSLGEGYGWGNWGREWEPTDGDNEGCRDGFHDGTLGSKDRCTGEHMALSAV